MARSWSTTWRAVCAQMFLGMAAAAAEPAGGPEDEDPPDASMSETITVSASRRREVVLESPRAVSVVRREEMDRRQARTTPEALVEEPGVFVQRTNYGGGAPFVRGQFGNRILLPPCDPARGHRAPALRLRAEPGSFLRRRSGLRRRPGLPQAVRRRKRRLLICLLGSGGPLSQQRRLRLGSLLLQRSLQRNPDVRRRLPALAGTGRSLLPQRKLPASTRLHRGGAGPTRDLPVRGIGRSGQA